MLHHIRYNYVTPLLMMTNCQKCIVHLKKCTNQQTTLYLHNNLLQVKVLQVYTHPRQLLEMGKEMWHQSRDGEITQICERCHCKI